MPRFPLPSDELWITRNGEAVPVKSLPSEEWNACKKIMMKNVGNVMSADWIGESFISEKRG